MNLFPLRLKLSLIRFAGVMVLGTGGFSLIENHSFLDASDFTIETVATASYCELAPLIPAGRILAIILTITGVGTTLGAIAGIAELFINRRENLRRHQKRQMLVGTFFSGLGVRLQRYCAESGGLSGSATKTFYRQQLECRAL